MATVGKPGKNAIRHYSPKLAETRRNSCSIARTKPDWFLDSDKSVMKQRFIRLIRTGDYYSEDTLTRKRHSLRTKGEAEALTLTRQSSPPITLLPETVSYVVQTKFSAFTFICQILQAIA